LNLQSKLQHELNDGLDQQRRLTEKLHDFERKTEILQTTIHELRESVNK